MPGGKHHQYRTSSFRHTRPGSQGDAGESRLYAQYHTSAPETEGVRFVDLVNRQWDTEEVRSFLHNVLHRNGQPDKLQAGIGDRLVLLNACKIGDDDGGGRILLILEELTDHARLLRELEQSEAPDKKLVEEVNSIIIEVDERGSIRFVNRFTEKLFGYDRNELIGRTSSAPSSRNATVKGETIRGSSPN